MTTIATRPQTLTAILRAKYFTISGHLRPYSIIEGQWEEFKMYQEETLVGFVTRTGTGFKVFRNVCGLQMETRFKFSDIKIY